MTEIGRRGQSSVFIPRRLLQGSGVAIVVKCCRQVILSYCQRRPRPRALAVKVVLDPDKAPGKQMNGMMQSGGYDLKTLFNSDGCDMFKGSGKARLRKKIRVPILSTSISLVNKDYGSSMPNHNREEILSAEHVNLDLHFHE